MYTFLKVILLSIGNPH